MIIDKLKGSAVKRKHGAVRSVPSLAMRMIVGYVLFKRVVAEKLRKVFMGVEGLPLMIKTFTATPLWEELLIVPITLFLLNYVERCRSALKISKGSYQL